MKKINKESILLVTNHFFPENVKINDVASELSKSYKVTVVTTRPNYPSGKFYPGYSKVKTKNNSNSTIYRLPVIARGNGKIIQIAANYISYFFSLSLFFVYIFLLRRKFSKILVHHTSPPFLTIPPIFYKMFYPKTNLIYWELDLWPESLISAGILKEKSPFSILITTIMKQIYKAYDVILIGSLSYKQILLNRTSVEKLHYFPNWAEPIIENYVEEKKVILPDGFNFIYAGNIGTVQNLSVIPNILNQIKNVNFIFIGDGKFKKDLKILVQEKRLEDRILFFDYMPLKKLIPYLKSSNALFLSLIGEGVFENTVPAKLQAYMAIGKPILGLVSGESKDLIETSRCGIVPDQDEEQIRLAIEEMKNFPVEMLTEMGLNGKRYYRKNFSFNKRLKELLHILSE